MTRFSAIVMALAALGLAALVGLVLGRLVYEAGPYLLYGESTTQEKCK